MADEPGATGNLGSAAQEMLSALRSMSSTMDSILGKAERVSTAFRDASQHAARVSTGPDAHAGGAGGTGAGAKTSMANSLGDISVPPMSFSQGFAAATGTGGLFDRARLAMAGGGERGAASMGAAGQFAGAAARTAVNAGASAVEAVYNMGVTDPTAAAEIMRARMRGQIAGQDYDTLRGNLAAHGMTPTDTVMAVDRYMSSGLLARGASSANLSSIISMSNIAGLDAGTGAAVSIGTTTTPSTIYGAQAAGISLLGPGGRPAEQHEIVNQIVGRFTQGRSREEVERALTPGIGNLYQSLAGMGMSPEQIEMLRPAIQEATEMGRPITAEDLTRMGKELVPEGEQAQQRRAASLLDKTEQAAEGVDEEFARATDRVSGFNEAVAELDGPLGTLRDLANELGTSFSTLTDQGVPGLFAAIESAASAMGVTLPGPQTSRAEGDVNVASDMTVKVHQGEMILPSRIASAVRGELGLGSASQFTPDHKSFVGDVTSAARRGGAAPNVTINVNVQQASEAEARRLAEMVQRYLKNGSELSGIGLGQVIM